MAIQLPTPPTANERLLAGWEVERHTGIVGAALTLNRPCAGPILLTMNGSVVDSDTYTVDGAAVTLGSAAIAGDIFIVLYLARSN